jgi:transcriptional regulator GlxA family with amidase domain
VIKVLNTHALDPSFSLDKAAKLLFFSKRKLHNFLVKNGTSYSKVIMEYRVNYLAGKIVQQNGLLIKTLCSQSGFNSVNTANIAFKKIKGMSLSTYRKELQV